VVVLVGSPFVARAGLSIGQADAVGEWGLPVGGGGGVRGNRDACSGHRRAARAVEARAAICFVTHRMTDAVDDLPRLRSRDLSCGAGPSSSGESTTTRSAPTQLTGERTPVGFASDTIGNEDVRALIHNSGSSE
jgi:hypothetical protein